MAYALTRCLWNRGIVAPSNKGMNLTICRAFKGRYLSLTGVIYSQLAGYAQRSTP